MLLPKFLRAICLTLTVQGILASPLPGKNAEEQSASSSNPAAIQDGLLRFGIEIETVIRPKKDGKIPEGLSKILAPVYEIRSKPKAKGDIQAHFAPKDAYKDAFKKVREQYLVSKWKEFRPQFQSSLGQGNMWMKAAHAEANENVNPLELKSWGLVDRWKNTNDQNTGSDSSGPYDNWKMVRDRSITYDEEKMDFPIEFVSPVLELGNNPRSYLQIRYEMEFFFAFLDYCGFEIVRNTVANTHVHVSPHAKPHTTEWTDDRLKRMISSGLFFEPAIRALIPREMWSSKYAKEWRHPGWRKSMKIDNPLSKKQDVLSVIKEDIEAQPDRFALIRKMNTEIGQYLNSGSNGSGSGSDSGSESDDDSDDDDDFAEASRYWGWNLENLFLLAGGKGTIEFRRGAQSTNAEEAMFYIELVIAFSLAACDHGDGGNLEKHFDLNVDSFRQFLYHKERPLTQDMGKQAHLFGAGDKKFFRFPEIEKKWPTITGDLKDPQNTLIVWEKSTNDKPVTKRIAPSK